MEDVRKTESQEGNARYAQEGASPIKAFRVSSVVCSFGQNKPCQGEERTRESSLDIKDASPGSSTLDNKST